MSRTRRSVTLAVSVIALTACTPVQPPSAIFEAETLCAERKWDEAFPLIRSFLMDHPDHPGGHLLLAQYYLRSADPWPYVAEGEVNTAMSLFEQNDNQAGLELTPDENFVGECEVDLAVASLRRMQMAFNADMPTRSIVQHFDEFRTRLQQARENGSASPRLENLEKRLEEFSTFFREEGFGSKEAD